MAGVQHKRTECSRIKATSSAARLDDGDVITHPRFLSGIRFQNDLLLLQTLSMQNNRCTSVFEETLDFNVLKTETIIY